MCVHFVEKNGRLYLRLADLPILRLRLVCLYVTVTGQIHCATFFFFFFFFAFLLFRASPTAGSSQARGRTGATAAGLRHRSWQC